jgi:predicted nucleic acid-binding Zn finger protein
MATPKLQTTVTQRAAEIATESILPMLSDGRFVVIGKRDIYLTNTERCSCGAFRMQKADAEKIPCKHMRAVVERAN